MMAPRSKPASSAAAHQTHGDVRWPEAAWKQRFRRRLLAWYRRNARELPWRGGSDPYRVWISEVMLQQTQVATVRDYFARFVATFPTIQALAEAPEQQVLRQWEGLGYYRRARQLHRAARVIVHEHGGRFPRDPGQVRRLPGIGRYTAGAITSIAFGAREPILEANTMRLLSRLAAYRGDPRAAAGQQLLWTLAGNLLPQRDCGTFNQALMELGSLLCTARDPQCSRCPVAALCRAHQGSLQGSIPRPQTKPPSQAVREAAVVVRRRGRVLLVRRGDGQRWAGLWDFPRFELAAQHRRASPRAVAQGVESLTGVSVRPRHLLATLKHGVTRFRITLECYLADYIAHRRRTSRDCEMRWVKPADFEDYPLSVTGRKLGRLVVAESM